MAKIQLATLALAIEKPDDWDEIAGQEPELRAAEEAVNRALAAIGASRAPDIGCVLSGTDRILKPGDNWGRCAVCQCLTTDMTAPRPIKALQYGAAYHGRLLCDDHLPRDHPLFYGPAERPGMGDAATTPEPPPRRWIAFPRPVLACLIETVEERIRHLDGHVSNPNGSAMNGAAANGSALNGAATNGSARSGATHNGSAHNGATHNGAAHNGVAHNGAANGGTTNGHHVADADLVRLAALLAELRTEYDDMCGAAPTGPWT